MASRSNALVESPARARSSFSTQPRARRELLIFGPALVAGLLVVPLLTWIVGSRILGPYSRGAEVHNSPLALLSDFFAGLAHGKIVYWLVALGPALFVLLFRIIARLIRPADGEV
jgi:hypothetical protein